VSLGQWAALALDSVLVATVVWGLYVCLRDEGILR
jgi:hypothetical protein